MPAPAKIDQFRTKPNADDAIGDEWRGGFHDFIATVRPNWGTGRRTDGRYLNPFTDDWWGVWIAAKQDR